MPLPLIRTVLPVWAPAGTRHGGLALAVAGLGHQAGGVDLAAQGRDRHGHGHGDQQIQIVALEQFVGL